MLKMVWMSKVSTIGGLESEQIEWVDTLTFRYKYKLWI